MAHSKGRAVQVLMASGPEALDRAVLGFAFALAAASSGADVTVVLTQKGTAWAKDDLPEAGQTVNGFSSVDEYMDLLTESGAVIRLCSSCAEGSCTVETRGRNLPFAGLAEVAMRATQDAATTVVF